MCDLRSFIETVRREKPIEVVDIHRQVNPRHETVAVLTKFEYSYRSPLLVFHRVAGCGLPLANNVCGSLSRLALALGCTHRELSDCYTTRCKHPIEPEAMCDGAVQEVVVRGKGVDLSSFPQLIYHEHDAPHAYITAAIVAARDPDSKKTNLSYHRLMITSANTTGIFMARGKHLDIIYRKYESAGQPMPIAAFIGAHPTWSLGAVYTGPAEVEEYDIIGGLQEKPLEVVPCVSYPELMVPADAEIVLEGVVLPNERTEEGPFGEFTGYATGTTRTPILQVKAITHKQKPIFQDIASGHMEHLVLPLLGMEYHLLSVARTVTPGCIRVKMVVPLTGVVVLQKTHDSQPRQVIEALLNADIYLKHVIVVDADVDPSDLRQVSTAVALHVQPDRDILIRKGRLGTELDPSCPSPEGLTSKMGIDATRPISPRRPIVKNSVPQALLDSINLAEFLKKPN
jgi:2,5-furandicarboxylate decarboxylase 1